jgi:N-acetylglucosaminyldiphosphoundecaprenol N-acetyl-beta-D-mannosaminyltransferase
MLDEIPAAMLAVGAAFDYYAGNLRRPPAWMQRHGLEWLARLIQEPRRLWRRYLKYNALFVMQFAGAYLRRLTSRTHDRP